MLEVEHLTVSYGAHRALEDVSVRVAAGEICVILGANGAGKSSLLNAIGGMVRAAPGARIIIDGRDITQAKPHKVVEAGLALVPEGRGIFGDLTVAENLQLGAYGPQARTDEARRREQVLMLFPRLAERRSQIARTMSGGEQQMVAIGRALMSNPTILMLDEPSLGLSPLLTKDLFKSLKAVRETGVGILLVEQNAKQSLAIADRGYLIENGHITGEGTGEELARDPAVQAAYLGGASGETPRADRQRPSEEAAAAAAADMSARALAERAARIQRDHVNAVRTGVRHVNGLANGHGHSLAETLATSGEAITMSNQAHELSLQAAEFVKKATRIQREHVDAQRVDYHLKAASNLLAPEPGDKPAKAETQAPSGDPARDLGRQAADFAARAARIQHDHVVATREAYVPHEDGGSDTIRRGKRKLTGRGKKLAKKAEKLARKAEKLAEKAMRISD